VRTTYRNRLSAAIVLALSFASVQNALAQAQSDTSAVMAEEKKQDPNKNETNEQKAVAAENAAQPTVIDSVVVTATKFETTLMQTPVAVTAVTQETLDREGVLDVRDLANLVPNMQVGFSPSDSGVQVAIRGITSNNFTELGDPTVGVHVDGSYSPRPQTAMALMHDVERVEILRGPQGTLFGRNSTAGAINILTARPDTSGTYGNGSVELGNYNHLLLRGMMNVTANDWLAFRGSFMMAKADSYIDQTMDTFDLNWDTDNDGIFNGPNDVPADGIPNTDQRRNRPVDASDAYGNADRWAARLSMMMTPTENLSWMLTWDRYHDESAGAISLKDCEKAKGTFFACDKPQFTASINVPGELDMTVDTWRSLLNWEITDEVILEHRIAYSTETRYQAYDGDGGAFADPDHPAYGINRVCCGGLGFLIRDEQAIIDAGFKPFAIMPFEDLQLTTRYSNYDSLTSELQFKSNGDGPLRWVAGAFYLKEDNDIRFDVEIPFCCSAGIPLAQSFVQPKREVESKALFGQLDYQVSDKWNVTAGYRYSWDEKSDKGGSNHETIGYWVNPGQFDPSNSFWMESWGLIGIVPYWSASGQLYQAGNLTDAMGSLAEDFVDRVPGTDNSFKADWSKGTWRIGADYTPNENLFFYGYAATGYKAGGFGDKINVCDCEGGLTAFAYDPEETLTFEMGVKARLNDGKLTLIGTIFSTTYDDMQRTTWAIVGESEVSGRDIGTLLTTNIAEAQINGAEFEFDWIPWKGGRILGWAAYLDAEITKFPGAEDGWFCFERAYLGLSECAPEDPNQVRPDNTLRRPTDFTGNTLPWSPEFSLSVTFQHAFIVSDDMILTPSLTANWQSEMFFADNNFDEKPFSSGQDAFSTINASIRLNNSTYGWTTELYVYNLTDELVRNWADPGPGYMKASFFSPRTYGLKLFKEF
jgi:iron complex outermembrane receptor protein